MFCLSWYIFPNPQTKLQFIKLPQNNCHTANLRGAFAAVSKAALLTRHQSSGSVPLSIAVSQGSAVVCVLRLTLTDQLKRNKKTW